MTTTMMMMMTTTTVLMMTMKIPKRRFVNLTNRFCIDCTKKLDRFTIMVNKSSVAKRTSFLVQSSLKLFGKIEFAGRRERRRKEEIIFYFLQNWSSCPKYEQHKKIKIKTKFCSIENLFVASLRHIIKEVNFECSFRFYSW